MIPFGFVAGADEEVPARIEEELRYGKYLTKCSACYYTRDLIVGTTYM